jgi:hypothetical protein
MAAEDATTKVGFIIVMKAAGGASGHVQPLHCNFAVNSDGFSRRR